MNLYTIKKKNLTACKLLLSGTLKSQTFDLIQSCSVIPVLIEHGPEVQISEATYEEMFLFAYRVKAHRLR